MARADSNNSTIDPSRRRFVTIAAAASAVSATALAAAAMPVQQACAAFAAPEKTLDATKGSPKLRAAVVDLRESHERLEAAKARFVADEAMVPDWDKVHPAPPNGSKRARKRWARKWRENRDAACREAWDEQLDAERHFREMQLALARVEPRDMADLELKAAAAFVFDKEGTCYGQTAIVSYGAVLDFLRMRRAYAA
jgi:hypothetical protein